MANTYNKGKTVTIEVEIMRYTPFGSSALNSPANGVKLTVVDPNGDVVLNEATMTLSSTGKYYYILQTGVDWVEGWYEIAPFADGSDYDDYELKDKGFYLAEKV